MQTFLKELKPSRHKRIPDPNKPVYYWSEKDRYKDKIVDAFVIILRTQGCSWMFHSGCTMCGYFNDSMLSQVTIDNLLNQYQTAMKKYNDEQIVKIFTSGSFLDKNEVPLSVQEHILSDLDTKTQKIAVETRPEYVTETSMNLVNQKLSHTELDIGIGLETSQDQIRDITINKGFRFQEYKKAVDIIHQHGYFIKTYILIKPPFLTEKEAIMDTKKTIDHVLFLATKSDILSFNPTSIQKNTLVEYLWRRKQYRPPWLWSIIDILSYASNKEKNIRLQCDITGGGKKRGAHNCPVCDHKVLEAIKEFSLTQDSKRLQGLDCSCKELWTDQLTLEPLVFGSIPDVMNP
jgi:archaeosine synthase beta-subunit